MTPECSTPRQAGRRGARFLQVLLLSGLAGCGYATQEEETLHTTRQALAPERCVVESPFTPGFQPELAWERLGGPDGHSAFTHLHVRMMPVVVDVSGDGVPDIVFIASRGLGSLGDGRSEDDSLPKGTFSGILRAYSGDDGRELWSVTDMQYRVRGMASLAAGDIDGDGLVELCTVPVDGLGVSCFENDGTFKFRTTRLEGGSLPFNEWGGPALADLDGDGTVEILVGNHAFTATGETKWVGSDGAGPEKGSLPFAVDLDQDGTLEVVNGRSVYRHDGTLRCANLDIGHGLSAVADFDGDGRGELVVSWGGSVTLLDDDCSMKWTQGIPGGNIPGSGERSGPPTIADVDGDGQPEIAVAGAYRLAIFEADGSIRWQQPIQERIRMSGATAFDFEGDGRTELVYADGQYLRIHEGSTGAVRFMTMHSSSRVYDTSIYESGIPYELPVVADLDTDGRADLLLASSSYGLEQSSRPGLRVFHDRNEGWVGARRIWNQHAYSVVNINDDGTVPAWQGHGWNTPERNTFRVNARVDASALPAADLRVAALSAGCVDLNLEPLATQQLRLEARVLNTGEAPAPSGVRVAFYTGAPGTGGVLLGTTALSQSLAAQAEEVVTLTLSPAPDGLREVWAVVDDDGTGSGQVMECIEDNNTASTPVSGCTVPNLPPVALCRDVTVPADATCQASASV
ncbi:MAG TPA: FG-GAP-like repeat-containing protein, partial [Myxococcaceae bacterium]|nr:FG-GAP-like repeat-containing protein [Myxococcaceae bacterium]